MQTDSGGERGADSEGEDSELGTNRMRLVNDVLTMLRAGQLLSGIRITRLTQKRQGNYPREFTA